jgi:solute carrier family 30 (zinc transporter), member 9
LLCSLISAVGIFCLGAGVSIVHGIHSILEPSASVDLGWGLAVLVLATFVEGYTLLVAVRAVQAGARAAGMRFVDFVKSGRDPVTVAIMAEDSAAVLGVIIAGVCTQLAKVTHSVVCKPLQIVCVCTRNMLLHAD